MVLDDGTMCLGGNILKRKYGKGGYGAAWLVGTVWYD